MLLSGGCTITHPGPAEEGHMGKRGYPTGRLGKGAGKSSSLTTERVRGSVCELSCAARHQLRAGGE